MSDSIDTRQVTLRLTKNKDVLAQMRKNRVLKPDAKGDEVFVVQFNSHYFYFKQGVPVTVAKRIGDQLVRSAHIIVGGHLDGPIMPCLDTLREFDVTVDPQADRRPTQCPICGKEMESIPRLSKHLLTHRDDVPELYRIQKKVETVENVVEEGPTDQEIEAVEHDAE